VICASYWVAKLFERPSYKKNHNTPWNVLRLPIIRLIRAVTRPVFDLTRLTPQYWSNTCTQKRRLHRDKLHKSYKNTNICETRIKSERARYILHFDMTKYDTKMLYYRLGPLHLLFRTRQHSYRKEDRAMRPIYGCPEKFSESSLRSRLLFQKFVMDFCSDRY